MSFTLNILGKDAPRGYKIMVFGPTDEGDQYAIACVCYECSGLRCTVVFTDIYAYASTDVPRSETILEPGLVSPSIFQISTKVKFDGNKFFAVDGRMALDDYAIENASQIAQITTGLAQAISLNNSQPGPVPINLQTLRSNMTTYFSKPDSYWIGAGSFPNLQQDEPGLVLPTEVLLPNRTMAPLCSSRLTLTQFSKVDCTNYTSATATYDTTNNLFKISYNS